MLFVLMLALLLAMVTACVAFAVEVSKLKSEVSSFQQPLIENLTQQLCQELLRSNQQLNSSIRMANQQLVQEYAARVFPLDSCAALPPSSPSGHYWVRTLTGSAVLVYCDPTRSCGGVTGGWRRVAELDMTNSSQQCPSALRQRNDNNTHTCGIDPDRGCSSLTFPTDSLSYSKVCGKVRAYQVGSPDSFGDGIFIGSDRSNVIDTNYTWMVLVSLMDPQDNTSGPLLQLLMKWALTLQGTVLALTGIKQVWPLDLQLSWGMTTSVIQDLVVPLI